MIVQLDRFGWIDGGVFSRLHANGFDLVAAEPDDAAIPTGVYEMRRDKTGRFQWWVLVGDRVGLAGSGRERTQVEFHAGNWPTLNSEACVLPGKSIRRMVAPGDGTPLMAVTDSRVSLELMLSVLGDEDHTLIVTEGPGLR